MEKTERENKKDSGLILFMREIASNPSAMGAACPSSKRLAAGLAEQVPLDSGYIIELGAGTGVVTSALLSRGINPQQLLVIERSEALAHHLRKRFNHLKIIQGDAQQLEQLIAAEFRPVQTIVSGLPLRSLPTTTVQTIGLEIEKVLTTGGLYIQFTYTLWRPPLPPSPSLCWVHSEYIWWNLPPARVDVFRYAK